MTTFARAILMLLPLMGLSCLQYSKPVVTPPLSPEEQAFETVWQASQDVLREYRFVIDVTDRRAGVLRTYPITGQYCLEFWRRDAVNRADLAEGTVQTVKRQVEVQVVADPKQPGQYTPVVDAQVWRSDAPARRITNTSQAYSLFIHVGALENTNYLMLSPDTTVIEATDVLLGPDDALAQAVRRDILKATAKPTGRS